MTAEAMTGAREKCIEAGMDDYIAKPVRLDDIVEALQKWCLQRNKAHPEVIGVANGEPRCAE